MLRDVLGKNLPPIFKIYVELARRADPITHSFTCSIENLAECIGYDRIDLESALVDPTAFNMIDIETGYEDSARRVIILHVY